MAIAPTTVSALPLPSRLVLNSPPPRFLSNSLSMPVPPGSSSCPKVVAIEALAGVVHWVSATDSNRVLPASSYSPRNPCGGFIYPPPAPLDTEPSLDPHRAHTEPSLNPHQTHTGPSLCLPCVFPIPPPPHRPNPNPPPVRLLPASVLTSQSV